MVFKISLTILENCLFADLENFSYFPAFSKLLATLQECSYLYYLIVITSVKDCLILLNKDFLSHHHK